MKPTRLEKAKKRLQERSEAVRADIRRELEKSDQEQYSTLTGQISDAGEESVAHLLVDVNLAEISRDVHELRELEAALARVEKGTYGNCIDCGTTIDEKRLDAVPAAPRCFSCQVAFEGKDQREHHRSI